MPRHPERFDSVADLALRAGFPVKRRSQNNQTATGAEIMVLDTIGELSTAYRFATVAFVGGTLIPHGGQSILEPAWYAKPIVIGPSMENFRQIVDDFRDRGAVRQIQAIESDKEAQIEELTDAFVWLLEDEKRRTALGQAAYSVFEKNRGAARFTVDKIAAAFSEARKGAISPMSLLGQIRVCETHGIRRFLYPLSLEIPASLNGRSDRRRLRRLLHVAHHGRRPPHSAAGDAGRVNHDLNWRLDFALSLSPLEKLELKLFSEHPGGAVIEDPLQIEERPAARQPRRNRHARRRGKPGSRGRDMNRESCPTGRPPGCAIPKRAAALLDRSSTGVEPSMR